MYRLFKNKFKQNNWGFKMKKIIKIAKQINLKENEIECYGENIAKINKNFSTKKGKLILVSSINPTVSGEGKTTISIGLTDALNLLGKKAIATLREPSLGPVFGLKGGAVGGGKSMVVPSEEINLHFTGDFHAITSANNLLCSMIDNHLYFGNTLNIDENNILFHRCLDMNDRSLREITISQEKLAKNIQRKESFTITAASEIMAIVCLSQSLKECKRSSCRRCYGCFVKKYNKTKFGSNKRRFTCYYTWRSIC